MHPSLAIITVFLQVQRLFFKKFVKIFDNLAKIISAYIWLVSLFNGISTHFRLFNAKAILLGEQ